MDGPAPAIVNAVGDALGVPFNSIPLLPEDIYDALGEKTGVESAASATRGER
jgi:CO/xanthine dehydrogenase Mo-binding subunit